MPLYYNKTRGPLPLELRSGSRVVAPKSAIDIAPEDEGSASVVRYVRKGFLVPPRHRPAAVVPVVVAPKPVPAPAPKPAPAPAPKPAAVPAPAPAPKLPEPKAVVAEAKSEMKPSPVAVPPLFGEKESAEDTEEQPTKSSKSSTRSRR